MGAKAPLFLWAARVALLKFSHSYSIKKIRMKTFKVEALEKFYVKTTYFVEAKNAEEAEEACRSGEVAYDRSSIQEGDEEWIETCSVEEDPDVYEFPGRR